MAARGLGKGLDAMIPKAIPAIQEDKIVQQEIEKSDGKATETIVKITQIEPNRDQPRKEFEKEALEELSDSIKQHGLIQPILVQDRKDHYEIIAGERRWRAARLAGLKEVPVIIRNYSEQEIVEISLIENLQRKDLNPIEEAMAYKKLMTDFDLKQEEVAVKVSKSRSTITNSMRLLKLSKKVQDLVIKGKLSEGHARTLLSIEDSAVQDEVADKIIAENLSVRDVEKLVKNYGKPAKEKPVVNKELDIFYQDIAEKLKQNLGTKVQISGKGDGSGKIEIEFYTNEELDRLIARIK
ncbi:MAG: ParB/RepB/Spo0J family partition protein [Lachnospiraceae bacterium]|jgi:ParB family chromosome partitioning protein|nr:ParB/RepB/Spo0J family partition protein [Lachnospiraceae bacterium]